MLGSDYKRILLSLKWEMGMATVQRAFRLEETLDLQFCHIAERLGTSPSDALRMFVTAFVDNEGFPFELRLPDRRAFHRNSRGNLRL